MRISVFGLGYVGTVSAACLAERGHTLIGVDTNLDKVQLLDTGKSPIVENQISQLLMDAHHSSQLSATDNVQFAIDNSDISFVCVGTPSRENGSLNLSYVDRVCREIGAAIAEKGRWHDVVIRSTMLPGSTDSVVIPALESAAGKLGEHFGLCVNPEFLREGTAVYDFKNPPKTVVGVATPATAEAVKDLFSDLPGPMLEVPYTVAECAKYVDNVWHALKVGFANEVGRVCRAVNLDSRDVMNVFKQDTKLNISDKYLNPGFAFGGSCLPKDVRAFSYLARDQDVSAPIIDSLIASNIAQIRSGIKLITETGNKNIGVLGFAFKAGTDDLRESPIIDVIEQLLGKGYKLRLFDSSVNMARLSGANRDDLLGRIPHIAELMVDSVDEIFSHAKTIVIGNAATELEDIKPAKWNNLHVVDLVGCLPRPARNGLKSYSGPGWPSESE
jgi:GDP-mannose 6-dehydrogenase